MGHAPFMFSLKKCHFYVKQVNQWTLFKVQLLPAVTLSNSDKHMHTATSLVLHELLAESAHSGHITSCTEFYHHQSSSIYHNLFHLAKTDVAK